MYFPSAGCAGTNGEDVVETEPIVLGAAGASASVVASSTLTAIGPGPISNRSASAGRYVPAIATDERPAMSAGSADTVRPPSRANSASARASG